MNDPSAEEQRLTRWRFYSSLLFGVPRALWNASDAWSRVVEFVLVAGFLIPPLTDAFRSTLTANRYWITLASFLLLVLFGTLESTYGATKSVERRARDAQRQAAELKERLTSHESQGGRREALGQLLLEGQHIQQQCGNEKEPAPSAQAQEWADKTEGYLAENLGESYIARFRSSAGLPMTANSISSLDHRNLWAGLHVRLA